MRIRFTIDFARTPKPVPVEPFVPDKNGADSSTSVAYPDAETHRMGFVPAPMD